MSLSKPGDKPVSRGTLFIGSSDDELPLFVMLIYTSTRVEAVERQLKGSWGLCADDIVLYYDADASPEEGRHLDIGDVVEQMRHDVRVEGHQDRHGLQSPRDRYLGATIADTQRSSQRTAVNSCPSCSWSFKISKALTFYLITLDLH